MECTHCGCKTFNAHQVCHMDVVVDGNNNWESNGDGVKDAADSIYESGTPFGPYTCTECGKEYSELVDNEWDNMAAGKKVSFLEEQGVEAADALEYVSDEKTYREALEPYVDKMALLNT